MERRRTGARGGAGGGRWLTAAVAAGCALATLTAGPSWAGQRPDPRPIGRPVPPPAPAPAVSDSDLEVIRLDPDAAPPGGRTSLHAFVANRGPDTTASPFDVLIVLPAGTTAEEPFFPETCTASGNKRHLRCTFGPGLREGRSATAIIPVRISPDAPTGPLLGGEVAVHSPDDRNGRNNRQPFEIEVVETAAA
ncbi:hypothetical protein [Kitasatospora sp. NPDC127060]|uniref:hypothetical protein n=1 Tax=Kitasatospora sp. NPDC127060 TaxID=3347121 RepID=UPI0036545BC7